ncbi:MAG: GspE/PulE family protein [Candidatus Staskawiczbacteria bacterium]|nr:GspE/PulE family protein [Candidatus Staskawiczbacteria bacterium]
MKVDTQKLKKFLLESELVTEKQFEKALEEIKGTDRDVGDVLVSNKLLTGEDLSRVQSHILGIPFINLEKQIIEPEVLKIIPESIARVHNIVAFSKKKKNLEVAMLDPEDLRTIEFIGKTDPSLKILPRITTRQSIKNVLAQYQKTLETEFGELVKEETTDIKHIKEEEIFNEDKEGGLKKAAEDLPIIKIVDTLLKHAILERASDVHIEPLEKEVIVRYRIDGMLHIVMTLPISSGPAVVARIKVLSNLKLDEHRLPQDGRFKIETEDFKYSVRVSVLPVFNGEKIVMRLLPEDNKKMSLSNLGLDGRALEEFKDNIKRSAGMILVTGPTGSGKTTTLYTAMDILNTPAVNISTVEDPIEYRMPGVNQTQVNSKIGLTFASGLRVLLRQDPNIIMVGEIRDNETADLAINAALTGHLVLSTLHTTEAAGAIPRLIDMKAEPFLLASTLNLILAQRLVRKFYGEKEAYKLSQADIKNLSKYCDTERILKILKDEKLVKAGDKLEDVQFFRPVPSEDSADGYRGRIAIYEVLHVTETIKALVIKKVATKEITNQAIAEGMRTMVEDGFVKAARGVTSIEEILRVIIE